MAIVDLTALNQILLNQGLRVMAVPKDWVFPIVNGEPQPLMDGAWFEKSLNNWCTDATMWMKGQRRSYKPEHDRNPVYVPIEDEYKEMSYEEYAGPKPDVSEYTPVITNQEVIYEIFVKTLDEQWIPFDEPKRYEDLNKLRSDVIRGIF